MDNNINNNIVFQTPIFKAHITTLLFLFGLTES